MNTRFNFLVQMALVAMFFGFSTVDGFGQFRTGGGATGVDDDDGTFGCYDETSKYFYTNLLFIIPESVTAIDVSNIEFECDLHIKFGTYIQSMDAFQDPTLISLDSLGYEGRFGLYYNFQLPIPKRRTSCERGEPYEIQSFMLDLLCFDGEEFYPFNPCQSNDFEFLDYVYDDCSLATTVHLKICCDTEISDGEDEFMTAGRSLGKNLTEIRVDVLGFGDEIKVTSLISDAKMEFNIFNFSGQSLLSGMLDVSRKTSENIDVSSLSKGSYIFTYSTNSGNFGTKKIIKM